MQSMLAPSLGLDVPVAVAVRIRQPNAKELASRSSSCVVVDAARKELTVKGQLGSAATTAADCIISEDMADVQVFQSLVQPLLTGALMGYDSALMLYGHPESGCSRLSGFTSLGKAHVQTDERSHIKMVVGGGLVSSVLAWLFHQQQVGGGLRISCQLCEVSSSKTRDLLKQRERGAQAPVHDAAGGISRVVDCPHTKTNNLQEQRRTTLLLQDLESALKTLALALDARDTKGGFGATESKQMADRAQVEIAFFVETRDRREASGWACGKFSMVQLVFCGQLDEEHKNPLHQRSYRDMTTVTGICGTLNSAKAETSFENIAHMLPFRNSSITHHLQDVLRPECRNCLLFCISPSARSSAASMASVRFASAAFGKRQSAHASLAVGDKCKASACTLHVQMGPQDWCRHCHLALPPPPTDFPGSCHGPQLSAEDGITYPLRKPASKPQSIKAEADDAGEDNAPAEGPSAGARPSYKPQESLVSDRALKHRLESLRLNDEVSRDLQEAAYLETFQMRQLLLQKLTVNVVSSSFWNPESSGQVDAESRPSDGTPRASAASMQTAQLSAHDASDASSTRSSRGTPELAGSSDSEWDAHELVRASSAAAEAAKARSAAKGGPSVGGKTSAPPSRSSPDRGGRAHALLSTGPAASAGDASLSPQEVLARLQEHLVEQKVTGRAVPMRQIAQYVAAQSATGNSEGARTRPGSHSSSLHSRTSVARGNSPPYTAQPEGGGIPEGASVGASTGRMGKTLGAGSPTRPAPQNGASTLPRSSAAPRRGTIEKRASSSNLTPAQPHKTSLPQRTMQRAPSAARQSRGMDAPQPAQRERARVSAGSAPPAPSNSGARSAAARTSRTSVSSFGGDRADVNRKDSSAPRGTNSGASIPQTSRSSRGGQADGSRKETAAPRRTDSGRSIQRWNSSTRISGGELSRTPSWRSVSSSTRRSTLERSGTLEGRPSNGRHGHYSTARPSNLSSMNSDALSRRSSMERRSTSERLSAGARGSFARHVSDQLSKDKSMKSGTVSADRGARQSGAAASATRPRVSKSADRAAPGPLRALSGFDRDKQCSPTAAALDTLDRNQVHQSMRWHQTFSSTLSTDNALHTGGSAALWAPSPEHTDSRAAAKSIQSASLLSTSSRPLPTLEEGGMLDTGMADIDALLSRAERASWGSKSPTYDAKAFGSIQHARRRANQSSAAMDSDPLAMMRSYSSGSDKPFHSRESDKAAKIRETHDSQRGLKFGAGVLSRGGSMSRSQAVASGASLGQWERSESDKEAKLRGSSDAGSRSGLNAPHSHSSDASSRMMRAASASNALSGGSGSMLGVCSASREEAASLSGRALEHANSAMQTQLSLTKLSNARSVLDSMAYDLQHGAPGRLDTRRVSPTPEQAAARAARRSVLDSLVDDLSTSSMLTAPSTARLPPAREAAAEEDARSRSPSAEPLKKPSGPGSSRDHSTSAAGPSPRRAGQHAGAPRPATAPANGGASHSARASWESLSDVLSLDHSGDSATAAEPAGEYLPSGQIVADHGRRHQKLPPQDDEQESPTIGTQVSRSMQVPPVPAHLKVALANQKEEGPEKSPKKRLFGFFWSKK